MHHQTSLHEDGEWVLPILHMEISWIHNNHGRFIPDYPERQEEYRSLHPHNNRWISVPWPIYVFWLSETIKYQYIFDKITKWHDVAVVTVVALLWKRDPEKILPIKTSHFRRDEKSRLN